MAKAVLGVHTLQLSHRSGQNCRFARQPVMGHLMVLNESEAVQRQIGGKGSSADVLKKLIRSLKILKTCKVSSRRAICRHLDRRPSTFSDSSVWQELFACFCLLTEILTWPNLDMRYSGQPPVVLIGKSSWLISIINPTYGYTHAIMARSA